MQQPELDQLYNIGRKLDGVIKLLQEMVDREYAQLFAGEASQDSRSEQSNHATFHGALKGAMAVCTCILTGSDEVVKVSSDCPYHGSVK